MKKKILNVLGIGALCLAGMFAFAGCGNNAEPYNAEIHAIYVMAQENGYTGTYEEWLASIKGEKGATGDNIELRVSGGYIQWKTTSDTTWQNLISIDSLKGNKGDDGVTPTITISDDGYWIINGEKTETKAVGQDGKNYTIGQDGYWYLNGVKTDYKAIGEDATYSTYTVTYDYGVAIDFFDNVQESKTIKSTEWLTQMPTIKDEYNDMFIGWFIKETNKEIQEYDFIGGNVALEAIFASQPGLYKNGKCVKTWDEIKSESTTGFATENYIKQDDYFKSLNGYLIISDDIHIIDGAFINCNGLSGVSIPETVTLITNNSFQECTGLNCIDISGSTYIDSFVFYGCSNLPKTTEDGLVYIKTMTDNYYCLCGVTDPAISIATINSQCKRIGSLAFAECGNLRSLIILSSVSIGDYAFNKEKVIVYCYPEAGVGGGDYVVDITKKWYSETKPTKNITSYWHYDTDGVTPIIWENE